MTPAIRCSHTRLIPVAEAMALRRESNPNTHPPEQLRLLGKIIGETGWRSAVVISKRSGKMTKGHGRTEAAHLAGFEFVPIDDQDYDSEEQEIADVLADNLIADMSELDPALAKRFAEQLAEAKFDTEFAGLTNELFAELTRPEPQTGDAEPQIDRAAELNKVWQVQPGDLWRIGEHRLLCGDSTKREDVARVMGGEKADLCFTSPPYGASKVAKLRDHYVRGAKKRKSFYKDYEDNPDEWGALMEKWFDAARQYSDCVVCNVQMLADNKADLLQWLAKRASDFIDVVIWDKANGAPQMQAGVMSNAFEFLFIFGGNGSRAIPFSDWHGTVSNIVRIDPRGKNDNADNHRAVMPIELVAWVFTTLCSNASSALEPFCGSGTTMVACQQLGRKCRGLEISPDYCAVILQRMKDAFPKIAIEKLD